MKNIFKFAVKKSKRETEKKKNKIKKKRNSY